MRKFGVTMIGLAMVGLAACDRGQSANTLASDTALSRDLNLANQAQPFQRLDSLSGFETAPTASEDPSLAAAPAPVGRSTTASRGDVSTPSEGRVIVKKNTKRDAAIGAAAGAVIGAATSRNKVKGAVIGGVAGGVIGAIIGNNVDVQKKRVP
jgi:hypothetical protein